MKYLIKIILLFVISNGYAQHYPSIEYNTHDGLAQMQVIAVFEDSRGYIWASTKGGLSKFDGDKFESFYISDGLQGNLVSYITEDSMYNI